MALDIREYTTNGVVVEAVQLTKENILQPDFDDVHEWVDGKLFFSPAGEDPQSEIQRSWVNSETLRVTGLSVFTPAGKVKAHWFDWVTRVKRNGKFWVVTPADFKAYYTEVKR